MGTTKISEMKKPEECASLAEVRAEIDRIDEQVVSLIAKRAGYVRTAARFKATESAVAAPERQAAMLDARRRWAEREGVDPDLIEKLYREMVAYFISHEIDHWKNAR
jgi:isochorismate pyruvate lyase